MNHDIHDLVGAYAAGALDDAERAEFEAHLAGCADCRSEAAAYREVLARIAETEPVVPPAGLEEAVLATAWAGAADPSGAGAPVPEPAAGTDEPGPEARQPAAAEPSGDQGVVPLAPRRRRAATWLGAAAAAAAVFAGGVVVGQQTTAPAPVAADDVASVVAVASAGDAHFLPVDIMGTESRVVMSGEMDRTAFLASDLPTPAKGMCYQVWAVTADGQMQSAGTFTPDPDGHIAVVLEGGAQDVTKFLVTMEPPGGSDHPTGEMLGEVAT